MDGKKAKIVTSFCGLGWTAAREDYDLGMPCGSGLTEQAAIADLLEIEDERADALLQARNGDDK